jgi:phosphatidylinositol glycan class A protein
MGYKVVFTDHSLYGFADAGSIHMNKVLQFTLADIDQAICVSHTSKENTVLRSGISPEKVLMVPNAVDTAMFTPSPERLSCDEIVIVVISRLVYRKGADLLVEVIPEVCRLFPKVSWSHITQNTIGLHAYTRGEAFLMEHINIDCLHFINLFILHHKPSV